MTSALPRSGLSATLWKQLRKSERFPPVSPDPPAGGEGSELDRSPPVPLTFPIVLGFFIYTAE